MQSSTSSTMDTWDWGRVNGSSRKSLSSFSQLPSLPQQAVHDLEVEKKGATCSSSARKSAIIENEYQRVVWGRLALSPYKPRQALTRLEGAPDRHQQTGWFPLESYRPSTDISLPGAPRGFALVGHTERRAPMNRSPYGERDYTFGQAMLTMRTSIDLTQAGLPDLLHVSRRAVAEWEAGSSYPTTGHLKHLIALGVQQQAFAAGREVEEIRALWKAAHQKVLLAAL